MNFSEIIAQFSSFVWGLPLMILLIGTGLYLTLRLIFVQIRGFSHGVRIVRGDFDDENDPGEIH